MTKYELYLAKYKTFIDDLEELLNDSDWWEELNDIAEDIFSPTFTENYARKPRICDTGMNGVR